MPLDDAARPQHIFDAIRSAETFVNNRSREDLNNDQQLQFALARAVEIVGEAASKLSQDFRDSNPEIPWAAAIGMRNRLAHAYFDLDNDVLWTSATISLPEFSRRLAKLGGK